MATYNFLNKSTGNSQNIQADSGSDAVAQYSSDNGVEAQEPTYDTTDSGRFSTDGGDVTFSKSDDNTQDSQSALAQGVKTGTKMAGDFVSGVSRAM